MNQFQHGSNRPPSWQQKCFGDDSSWSQLRTEDIQFYSRLYSSFVVFLYLILPCSLFGEPSRVYVTSGVKDVDHNAVRLNKTKAMCKCLFLCFCMLIGGHDLKLLLPRALQQCMLYLYPQLLQHQGVHKCRDVPVHVYRSGSSTLFTLCMFGVNSGVYFYV